jgi:pSer/pThr/pTyr-binding forkhead associated (FHA) protein
MLRIFITEITYAEGVSKSTKKIREFALTGETPTTIGRGDLKTGHIKLSFPADTIGLSRVHATIKKEGGTWWCYNGKGDGSQKAGTPIRDNNGEECFTRAEITPGSRLTLYKTSSGTVIMSTLAAEIEGFNPVALSQIVTDLQEAIPPLLGMPGYDDTNPPADRYKIIRDLDTIAEKTASIQAIYVDLEAVKKDNESLRIDNARQDKMLARSAKHNSIMSKLLALFGVLVFIQLGVMAIKDDQQFDRVVKAAGAIAGLIVTLYGGKEMITDDKGKNPYLLGEKTEAGTAFGNVFF